MIGAAGGGILFKGLVFVKEGEKGALLRFGKFVRVVEPGFVLVIPFVHELRRVHVRQTTLNLAMQTITLRDNLSYAIQAVVLFRVTDVYHALFEMADLYASIKDIGGTILRENLAAKASADLHGLNVISDELKAALGQATKTWGVEILAFQLADVAPTPETARVLIQPELAKAQVEASKTLVVGIEALALGQRFVGVSRSLLSALILRGSGVPAIGMGNDDETPAKVGDPKETNGKADD